MTALLIALTGDHRAIDAGLDRLAESFAAGRMDAEICREVGEAVSSHYLREEEFLAKLHVLEPELAAKLKAQHDEASEIAVRLQESLEAGETADVPYLVRRFLAIARHNMIEEERDVFPLAMRCFSAGEDGP